MIQVENTNSRSDIQKTLLLLYSRSNQGVVFTPEARELCNSSLQTYMKSDAELWNITTWAYRNNAMLFTSNLSSEIEYQSGDPKPIALQKTLDSLRDCAGNAALYYEHVKHTCLLQKIILEPINEMNTIQALLNGLKEPLEEAQVVFGAIQDTFNVASAMSPFSHQHNEALEYLLENIQAKLSSFLSCLVVVYNLIMEKVKQHENEQRQMVVGIRVHLTTNLKNLTQEYSSLFQLTVSVLHFLVELEKWSKSETFPHMWNSPWINEYKIKTESFMMDQVHSSLIIAVQPQPTIRGDNALKGVQVTMLLQNIDLFHIRSVKARLLMEEDTKKVLNYNKISTTDLTLNSTGESYSFEKSSGCSYNMSLGTSRKRGKVGSMKVSEQVAHLQFEATAKLGTELERIVYATSLPVTYCSHSSQHDIANGKIMWMNLQGLGYLNSFEGNSTLPWSVIFEVFNSKWVWITGRPLSSGQNEYLRIKVVGVSDTCTQVTYDQLCKNTKTGRHDGSVWCWIQRAFKATEESVLKNLAKSGIFPGFMDKKQAESILMNSSPGSFILRFSDTFPGHITLLYRSPDGQRVIAVAPDDFNPSHKNFSVQLAEFIVKEVNLKYVYCLTSDGYVWKEKHEYFKLSPKPVTKGYDFRISLFGWSMR